MNLATGLKTRRMSDQQAGHLFIAPALLFIVAFIFYPTVYNIFISFHEVDIRSTIGDQPFVGLANYFDAAGRDIFWQSISNTFYFTFGSLLFQFVIGFALALLFARPFPGASMFRGVLMVSWLVPQVVTAILFRWIFAGDSGLLNLFLNNLGILQEPIVWLNFPNTAMWSLIVTNIWIGVPFNMLLIATGITTIPQDLYEAATVDGASSVSKFVRITLPLLKPTLLSVITLGFIYTFKAFDIVFVMTGGGPLGSTELMSTLAYRYSFSNFSFGLGAAVTNVLFLILIIVGLLYLYVVRREENVM